MKHMIEASHCSLICNSRRPETAEASIRGTGQINHCSPPKVFYATGKELEKPIYYCEVHFTIYDSLRGKKENKILVWNA